ncbi:MAG: DHH family phosphoesterase [Deltaproteobacteria bacterium]|nr:DHH family phosphoesterase [Deltaproteobacteria bacterium]
MTIKVHSLPRSSTMVDRLNRLYDTFKGEDRLLVIINADPDAISSAMALKRLLWRRVATVTMAHVNVIKRADNLAMIEMLKIPLVHLPRVNLHAYSHLAMVDSQPVHCDGLENLHFDVIIDHHPLTRPDASFIDVRPDYGATATMMTEYLRAAKIVPNRNLSTALFYGIKTDTNNFTRQGQLEDMRAFRYIFPRANLGLINKIENSEMTKASLKYFHEGLERVNIRKSMAWVYLGRVDNPDTLVLVADFFMRVRDINQVVAAGLFKDSLVVIFRTAGMRRDAGKLMARTFGRFGPAGGHRAMARADIPLKNLDLKHRENGEALEKFVRRQIQDLKRSATSNK